MSLIHGPAPEWLGLLAAGNQALFQESVRWAFEPVADRIIRFFDGIGVPSFVFETEPVGCIRAVGPFAACVQRCGSAAE